MNTNGRSRLIFAASYSMKAPFKKSATD